MPIHKMKPITKLALRIVCFAAVLAFMFLSVFMLYETALEGNMDWGTAFIYTLMVVVLGISLLIFCALYKSAWEESVLK